MVCVVMMMSYALTLNSPVYQVEMLCLVLYMYTLYMYMSDSS